MTTMKIQRLHPDARLPTYATAGAACIDLHALESGGVGPLGAHTFRTGLAIEVPEGHALLVFSRSGHGFAHDLRLANCVGVIDSDYRGEIAVRVTNDSHDPFGFKQGDRIAQAMLVQIPTIELMEVNALSTTARGAGGVGVAAAHIKLTAK